MTGLIVAKFGGTSVADFDAMSRCASIVASNQDIKVVVVSASSGVTNYLVRLAKGNMPTNERDAILTHIADIEFSILKKCQYIIFRQRAKNYYLWPWLWFISN